MTAGREGGAGMAVNGRGDVDGRDGGGGARWLGDGLPQIERGREVDRWRE